MNYPQKIVILILNAIVLYSCTGTMLHPIAPEVEITNVELSEIRFPKTQVVLLLDVTNPNDFDIHIASIDMRLYIKGYLLLNDQVINIATLVSHEKQSMKVPVKINLLNTLTLLPQLLPERKIPYVISGTVKLKDYDTELPFSYEGDMYIDEINHKIHNDRITDMVKKHRF